MALRDLDRLDLNILLPESDHTREQGDKEKRKATTHDATLVQTAPEMQEAPNRQGWRLL